VSDLGAGDLLAAIDIGGTKVKIGLADASGRLLATDELPSGQDVQASDLLHAVRSRLDALAEVAHTGRGASAAAGIDSGPAIAAAGIVSPGVISDGGVGLAPNNPGMSELTLAEITRILGVPRLAWANDVKAAAWAEHAWGGLRGAQCGLYLNLGTGLSAGAVIDGRPFNGANGAALEIGYLLPSGSYGPGHRSGKAPLEDLISGRALQDRAAERGLNGLRASDILAALTDAGSRKWPAEQVALAEEFLDQFTRAAVNLVVAFNADAICLGGGMAGATDVFVEPLRAMLDEYAPFPPRVSVAERPGDSSLFGALRVALDVVGVPPEQSAQADSGAESRGRARLMATEHAEATP